MKINPELKLLEVSINDLSLDPSNVRKHSDKNMSAITASLNKFGQQKPIVASSEGVILAGNGTYSAAKELGWEKIAVVKTDLIDPIAQKAYAIADNRTNDLSNFDDILLKESLEFLEGHDVELNSMGFDFEDMLALDWDSDIEGLSGDSNPDELDTKGKIVLEFPKEEEQELKSFLETKLSEISIEVKIK